MLRRTLLTIGILALGSLAAVPARADDPRQILVNSLSPTVGFWGDQVTTVNGPNGRSITTRERVYRKGSVLRIEYANGRVLFDDGTAATLYFPRPNTYEKRPTSFDPDRLEKERRQIRVKRLVVEQLADGEVAGRAASVISIKLPNGTSRTFWVDKQTGVQLRLDEDRAQGAKISSAFTSIHFADPPADKLAFNLPPGAVQVEPGLGRALSAQQAALVARPWGGPRLPRWTPSGYKLRGFYPHNFGKERGLVAVYDGPVRGETLSVFQAAPLGMSGMSDKRGRKLRVLSARRGTAEIMLVGPLPEPDLQRVMESIPE